jgi:Ca2+-dependent lipid-binding protein
MLKKMSPYLVINYKGIKYKTFADGEAGNLPHWNDTFHIPLYSLMEDICVSVYDDGLLYDELLGSKEVSLMDLVQNHN